jgi:hypothetical protein
MRSSSIRRFVLLAAVATASSGCGDESGLSGAELAQRANAICARYKPLYRADANTQTRVAILRDMDRTRLASAREERELRALRPRRNEAGKVQRLLDHVRASKRTLVQLRSATAAHDATAATKVWRRLAVENRVTTKEARALGWTVCASDPRW